MSRLAEIVKQSENSTAEQNESNLATVADYLTQLAKFTAASSNVVINDTVSCFVQLLQLATSYWINLAGCLWRGPGGELSASMESRRYYRKNYKN